MAAPAARLGQKQQNNTLMYFFYLSRSIFFEDLSPLIEEASSVLTSVSKTAEKYPATRRF